MSRERSLKTTYKTAQDEEVDLVVAIPLAVLIVLIIFSLIAAIVQY